MTHAFNSGAVEPQRTLIQDGALRILDPLLRSKGGYLGALFPWGAVLRSYTDEDGAAMFVKTMAGRAPSIAVATGTRNFTVTGIGGRQASSDLELLLYFGNNHARDKQRGRQASDVVGKANDSADPGLHVMMEHALELMLGQYPAAVPSIKQVRILREEEVATLQGITIWMQTYQVMTTTSMSAATPPRGGSAEFRTAQQLLTSIGWRVTDDRADATPPDPSTSSASVDFDSDLT